MADWVAPKRPAAYAEQALVTAILEGTYPPGSTLPGERDLAAQLGVTRYSLSVIRLSSPNPLSLRGKVGGWGLGAKNESNVLRRKGA